MDNRNKTGVRQISVLMTAVLGMVLAANLPAQVKVSGQASSAFIKSNDGRSQYAYNGGRGTFAWRADIFVDALLSENISVLSNFRMHQDEVPHIDLLALRFSDIGSTGITCELGEIELPFGNLGNRRFPRTNPFLSLPLMHEHLTTIRSSDYELWVLDSRYTAAGNGIHVLDQGLYDLGVKASYSADIFDFSVALTNGMVSATSGYYQGGLNGHSGFGTTFRVAATPVIGLTLGLSYATGPFLKELSYYSPLYYHLDPQDYTEESFGGDIDFAYGHFTLYGEAVHNVWKFKEIHGSNLLTTGYSLEGSYTIFPRFSLSARVGGLLFNSVTTTVIQSNYAPGVYSGRWDNDVMRYEGAAGYRLTREALIKVVYQWNRTLGIAGDPVDNVIAVQTVVSF